VRLPTSAEGRTGFQGKGQLPIEGYRDRAKIDPRQNQAIAQEVQHVIAASRVNDPTDHYTGGLYRALWPTIKALLVPVSPEEPFDTEKVVNFLQEQKIEAYHLHWPEHSGLSDDLNEHQRFINCLRELGIPIIWTQHNLKPHSNNPNFIPIYRTWAAVTAAAIHHSNWGFNRVRTEYDFPASTLHAVIPHGHYGAIMQEIPSLDRATCERELGMAQCDLRLGIIGHPRQERRIQMAMDAFAACRRRDLKLQLAVFSLQPEHRIPRIENSNLRICAWPYSPTEQKTYNKRISTFDLLMCPVVLEPNGSTLTSGIASDAIGAGRGALISDWPYLQEYMGAAGILYGRTAKDLTDASSALI
jgi:hypothetical protein